VKAMHGPRDRNYPYWCKHHSSDVAKSFFF